MKRLMQGWVIAALLLLAAGQIAHADDASAIRQVTKLAETRSWSAAGDASRGGSELVQAYYEWLNLQREDSPQSFERYQAFLRDHGKWPGTRRIRANAERAMATGITPDTVIEFYREFIPVTARGMVIYVRALEFKKQDSEARSILNEWFRDASLSLDEQNHILTKLKNELTPETLRLRLDELLLDDNKKQALALARIMGAGYTDLAQARIALTKPSRDVEARLRKVPANLRDDPGLVLDRMEWRRRKSDDAASMMAIFGMLPADFKPYNSRVFWNEQQNLIYRLMREKTYPEAYQVAVRPFHDDKFAKGQAEWMAGHIALVYLHQPGRAFRHFETLYKMGLSPLTRARAAYWAAEASMMLGYPDVARAWYRAASAFRGNFYGQLAAAKLPSNGRPYRQGPPVPGTTDRELFEQSELPDMARLLVQAGDTVRAEQFINRMADLHAGQGGMMRLIVDLASELKLISLAVKISRAAAIDGVDFADYVFPTLDDVGTGEVEPALVYAVIRQESGFDMDAVSPAGARGLMQLMPKTAKAVARAEKERHDHAWLTTKPDHNIRLGSAYLGQLINQYHSYPLVAAAYNAGPGRVNGWLSEFGDPRSGEITLVDWIERIPLYETRNYVQRILEGTVIYRQKLGINPAGLDELHLGNMGTAGRVGAR